MNPLIQNLPIAPYLQEISNTLKKSSSHFLILTAETAAGKSTAVPLSLLENFSGKILMLEPRRLAAVAIAGRVAELLGEETGQTSGYTLHLESVTSKQTRFEVITEAILTRRLQLDPSLEDVQVVVIDEFHERSVHGDLALAFLKEAMALRDDLFVIIMSATMDFEKISKYLGTTNNEPAPVMQIPGRQFPVEIQYDDKNSLKSAVLAEFLRNSDGISLSNDRSLAGFRTDSILVFLPGIYEIQKLKTELEESLSSDDAEILVLHSTIDLKQQKKVLSPVPLNSPRRIIISSAIAETSVTVPGVTTVFDSGFCRINKINLSLGMDQLVTEKISQFSADQRSGRAGRLMPGKCIRMWNKHDPVPREVSPEILRIDLSSLVLECAAWGASNPQDLSWLDCPSLSSWNSAVQFLEQIGLLHNGKITNDGKSALSLGVSPRFAAALLYGKGSNHTEDALDFVIKYSQYNKSSPLIQEKFRRSLIKKLSTYKPSNTEEWSFIKLLLKGFPDRLGKLCKSDGKDSVTYQFITGRKAVFTTTISSPSEWIVAPEVTAGTGNSKIYSLETVSQKEIENFIKEHKIEVEKVWFEKDTGKVKKTLQTKLGELILNETNLPTDPDDFKKALCTQIKEDGFSNLPLSIKSESLVLRAAFLAEHCNDSTLSSVLYSKLENLCKYPEEWLLPFINSTTVKEDNIYSGLYWYLDGKIIDYEVPEILILPNGKKTRISYENHANSSNFNIFDNLTNVRSHLFQPVIEIIIQQVFGCFTTPKVCNVPVLLKLLSPARRPLQVTTDLENFWTGAWIEICREMKGRYPKHNWDYRITD